MSESEQKYHMEAPLSQLGQCWLPATAPPVPEDPAVLLTALRSLLCAISMHRLAECSAFQKTEGPSPGTAGSRALWVRCLQPGDTDQDRGKPAAMKHPQHCPSLNRDPSSCTGGAPPGLPVTREGRRLLINMLGLALGWILADGHAHPKPAMDPSWGFASMPVMQEGDGLAAHGCSCGV